MTFAQMKDLALALLFVTTSASANIRFRDGVVVSTEDRPVVENFIGHAVKFVSERTPENIATTCKKSPETFAWVDFRNLESLLIAFELTGNTDYLDLFRDTFALYRNLMSTRDDGFLGWYGPPIPSRLPKDNPAAEADEIQTSFRAMAILGHWLELAQENSAYTKANAATISAYRDLLENHLFPKWDKRGYFVALDGGRGAYRGFEYPLPKNTTLSHEKLSIVVDGLLAMYRATGNPDALRRALRIGAYFKSCLTLKDGHYEWMSWSPAGLWDVATDKEDAWKVSWIGPDPNAEWYVAALSIALNLYQMNLLFTDEDLARFIRTQRDMCWNGNLENPEYRTVAGMTGKYVKGRFLSLQIAHYDPTLAQLGFEGVHAEEARKNSTHPWKGGLLAQNYIREKFLRSSLVKADPHPDRTFGDRFVADPENQAFVGSLSFDVREPSPSTPRKPSEARFLQTVPPPPAAMPSVSPFSRGFSD